MVRHRILLSLISAIAISALWPSTSPLAGSANLELAQFREGRDRDRDPGRPPQPPGPSSGQTPGQNLELLGNARVNNRMTIVEFRIDRRQSNVSDLRIRAGELAVLLESVEIVFADGSRQRVEILDRLNPGEQSRPIPVDPRRQVSQVSIMKRPGFRPGETTLQLVGQVEHDRGGPVAGPGSGPTPERVLARGVIDDRQDRIVYRVGRDQGPLLAIKFRVGDIGDKSVLTSRVEIAFVGGGGKSADLITRLMPGGETRPVMLDDVKRIESVTLWKRPSWRPGRTSIDLIGIPAPPPPQWGGVGPKIPPGWALFGAQAAGFTADRDSIPVGEDAGRFNRIVLRVSDNDLFLRELTIVYANGERDRKIVETMIPAGSQTRPIDLRGDRFIRDIEFVYRSAPDRRGVQSIVEVYGDYADDWISEQSRGKRNGGWLMLGAERASMLSKERDAIVVNPRVGRLKAIRISVRRSAVSFYSARIIYENGQIEDLPITRQLKDGQSTTPFDLKGRAARVNRIELKYRSKLGLKGEGIVEVWGLS